MSSLITVIGMEESKNTQRGGKWELRVNFTLITGKAGIEGTRGSNLTPRL